MSWTSTTARDYALRNFPKALPLDEDSIKQIVDYSLTLPPEESSNHLHQFLGSSEEANVFIKQLNAFRENDSKKQSGVSSSSKAVQTKSPAVAVHGKASTSSTGQNKTSFKHRNLPKAVVPKNSVIVTKPRLSSNKKGTTTSELLGKQQVNKSKKGKKLNSLQDLESAIYEIENNTPSTSQSERTTCNCNATRHPLQMLAPNCLNCGKIICIKEGLWPCSSCGAPLISGEERANIRTVLEKEKEQLTPRKPNTEEKKTVKSESKGKPFQKKNEVIKFSIGATGTNSFKETQLAIKKIERATEHEKRMKLLKEKREAEEKELKRQIKKAEELSLLNGGDGAEDPELVEAKKRLDNLLHFQETSAQRTRIIDQVSDFDLPTDGKSNPWASALDMALQLKKQQRLLRKMEDAQAAATGRGKHFVNISIGPDGNVSMKDESDTNQAIIPDNYDEDDEDLNMTTNFDDTDVKDHLEEVKAIKKEIRKKQKEELEESYKRVWDPEASNEGLIKPVYVKRDSTGDENPTKGKESKLLHKLNQEKQWARVQDLDTSETDENDENLERLLSMPSM